MINLIKLPFMPLAISWIFQTEQAQALIACSEKESKTIHILDGRGTDVVKTVNIHQSPVHLIRFNPLANTVVSLDTSGMVEYWSPDMLADSGFSTPTDVTWSFKSDTDLYEFKKSKTVPNTLVFSPDYSKFVTFGLDDRQVRLFLFKTGKMVRKYDESLQVYTEMQQAGTIIHKLDDMEFGRRLAMEREMDDQRQPVHFVFDESGNFLIYPSMLGIKVLNIRTNKVVRLLGKNEHVRFMSVGLYQGAPKRKSLVTMVLDLI